MLWGYIIPTIVCLTVSVLWTLVGRRHCKGYLERYNLGENFKAAAFISLIPIVNWGWAVVGTLGLILYFIGATISKIANFLTGE